MIVGHDDFCHPCLNLSRQIILCIHGIDADARQNDTCLAVYLMRDSSLELIDFICRAGILYLDVNRSQPFIRTIAVQDKIIGSVDTVHLRIFSFTVRDSSLSTRSPSI